MRQIIEQTKLHNLGVTTDYWFGKEQYQKLPGQLINLEPLRPPYEAWARAKGGSTTMALQKPGAKQLQGEDCFERRIYFPEYSVVEVST